MNTPQTFRLKAAVAAVAVCFAPVVWAVNPTGPTVVHGTVNFSNQGKTLLITNTPGAIINWQQFNIGKGFTTQFIQQSAQSTVLNRVVSNQPSEILGTLRSNGQVYLINQAGILFGAGAVVDVHGLIASTLNISNADFLLNRLRFNDGQGASVVNQGKITTPVGGQVYLIGDDVRNEGVIITPQGQVLLAAGKSITLVNSTTPNIHVTLHAGGQAINLGTAQGGSIDIYAGLIEQQGLLRANSATRDAQGNIVLSASQAVNLTQDSSTQANGVNGGNVSVRSAGSTTVAGQISATGTTGRGGQIKILGEQVTLTDHARVDASGDTGGGSALIGGDFQGKNAAVQNAARTLVAQGAMVNVDARVKGRGGRVVVWANDHTDYRGHITARGGAKGGNGGKVEVSGKQSLVFKGTVNTLAPKGQAGSLLLDPTTLCVLSGASVDPRCASVLDPLHIANAFWTNGTFTVQATGGDISLIDYIDLTRADGTSNIGKTLNFQVTNGNIESLSEAAAVNWKAGMGGTTLGGQIFSAGADVLFNAKGSVAAKTGGVHLNNSISTQGGKVTINAQGRASLDGAGGAFRVLTNGVTKNYSAGIYTAGGGVSIVAADFGFGFDSRYHTWATAPVYSTAPVFPRTVINTLQGGTGTGTVDGAVMINTASGGVNHGVWIKSDSTIYAGKGNVSLSGSRFANRVIGSTLPISNAVESTGALTLSFDHLDTRNMGVSVDSMVINPLTKNKNVYLGLLSNDPLCATNLCLFPAAAATGGNHLITNKGIGIGSAGNITVKGNAALDGGTNKYLLLAFNDIVFDVNSALGAATGTQLGMIAGNRLLNHAGANAFAMPWSLFAKDQSTTLLNGLTTTPISLGQNVQNFTPLAMLTKLNAGTNTGLDAVLKAMLVGGGLIPGASAGTNTAVFWGNSGATPPTPPTPPVTPPVSIDCNLTPALCNVPVGSSINNAATKPTPTTTSSIAPRIATADVTYSASLGVVGEPVWLTYSDVVRSRDAVRQAEEALPVQGRNDTAQQTQTALVSVKRAELQVRETEMELRAAEAEMRAATSPEARGRAEMRHAIAATRRADADVKRADAEMRQAEIDAKKASTPAARAEAAHQKSAAEVRKLQAEVKRAEADVEKANSETAQLANSGQPKVALAVKRADIEIKKAEVEIKRAEMDAKTTKDPAVRSQAGVKIVVAVAKKASAEAQKATLEAQRAEEEAQLVDTPTAHRVAESRRADAAVKQADAEVKQARAEVHTAKDETARRHAENKVAQAELKHAEAAVGAAETREKSQGSEVAKSVVAVKKAELLEKRAEVALNTEKDQLKKSEAAVTLADARVKRVEAEEKHALQAVREVRTAVKEARSEASKQVLLKKAEASEARVAAKHSESEAKKAELAVKRVENEVQQIESEAKAATSPEQRHAAEQRLSSKRGELDSKRADATQKNRDAEVLGSEAQQKEHEYHAEKSRRDERILESFGGMALATMDKGRVQEMMNARHDFLKEKFGGALKVLSANPKAANLRTCDSKDANACLRPAASMASFAADVIARVRMPLMSPVTAFLPEIQRKVAIVIGNNAYQDPDIPALNGAVRDADAIAATLKEKLGYEVRMVHNGSRADIVRTLNQVADETGSKDSVVVYYAGHGYQMEDTQEGYWIPSDGSTTSPENWISNTDINNMLMSIPAKQMMVVSDSCFSGALTREQQVSSTVTATQTPAVILGKRSVIVMSSGGDEPVMDEGRDGHSVFTWHLLDKLNQLNSYEHGAEVFDAIKAGVVQDGIPQTPQYGASVSAGHNTGGDYLFEVRRY